MQRQPTSKAYARIPSPEVRRIIALLSDVDARMLRRVATVVKAMLG
jgi:hypothetical protein